MSTFVRMRRTFAYDLGDGRRRTIPPGWAGHLDDDQAQAAIEGGYTAPERRSKSAPASTGDDRSPDPGSAGGDGVPADLDDMTREELDEHARDLNINPGDYRTKADLIKAIEAE